MADIEFSIREDGIARLTVNRPHAGNSLGWDAIRSFQEAIERLESAADVRALLITGAGKVFIAGGDIRELNSYPELEDGLRLAMWMGDALLRLEDLPFPTIAVINGPARGGGAELALACDIRVMSDTADIGFVHANLGLIPGWGGAARLLRLVGYSRGLEILATGRVVPAAEALRLGLANQVVLGAELPARAEELVARIATRPPEAIRAAKRVLRNLDKQSFDRRQALLLEQAEFPTIYNTPDRQAAFARFAVKK